MPLPTINEVYLIDILSGLLNTPSPTGFTDLAIEFTRQALSAFPHLSLNINRKGALIGLLAWRALQITSCLYRAC